jgi:hypothetical protein
MMHKALENWLAAGHQCRDWLVPLKLMSEVRAMMMAEASASVNETLVLSDRMIGPKQ